MKMEVLCTGCKEHHVLRRRDPWCEMCGTLLCEECCGVSAQTVDRIVCPRCMKVVEAEEEEEGEPNDLCDDCGLPLSDDNRSGLCVACEEE